MDFTPPSTCEICESQSSSNDRSMYSCIESNFTRRKSSKCTRKIGSCCSANNQQRQVLTSKTDKLQKLVNSDLSYHAILPARELKPLVTRSFEPKNYVVTKVVNTFQQHIGRTGGGLMLYHMGQNTTVIKGSINSSALDRLLNLGT